MTQLQQRTLILLGIAALAGCSGAPSSGTDAGAPGSGDAGADGGGDAGGDGGADGGQDGGVATLPFTTSVGELSRNNTGMVDGWNTSATFGYPTWRNNLPPWRNTSAVPVQRLLYPGSTTLVFMHLMPWWTLGGGGGHRNAGYSSSDPAQVRRQMDYLIAHGVHGVMPNWYGKDHQGGNHDLVARLWRDEGQTRTIKFPDGSTGPFRYAWDYDGGALKVCSAEWDKYTTDANVALSPGKCFDPSDIAAAFNLAELKNDDCEAAPFNDPVSFTGTLSADGRAGTTRDEASCYVSKHLLYDFAYSWLNHWQQPNYEKRAGRPLVTFFGVDGVGYRLPSTVCTVSGTEDCKRSAKVDWSYVRRMADKYFGRPLLLFRQSGGFAHPESDGAFCWIAHATDPYAISSSYLANFYSTGKSSGGLIVGCGHGAFNNLEAPWRSSESRTHPRCGRAWLETLASFNSSFSATTQAPYLQLNTLNDHEEGSGFEPGIESCWRVNEGGAPGLAGAVLQWQLDAVDPDGSCVSPACIGDGDGPERAADATLDTLDHFSVYSSDGALAADGTPRLAVVGPELSPRLAGGCYGADAATRRYSLDLACLGLPAGTHRLYVRAVGKAFIHNQLSAASPPLTRL